MDNSVPNPESSQKKQAQLENLETEIWQSIIEFIRGACLSEVLKTPIDLSYPVRVDNRNARGQILSRQSLANMSLSCRFLRDQVRLHRETFPHATQWDVKAEEDWARTLTRLVDSGYSTTIRGWTMLDLELTESKVDYIRDILLLSPRLTLLEAGLRSSDKNDSTTPSKLKSAMDTVIDRHGGTLQTFFWTNSKVDVLVKLRETSSATLSALNMLYSHQYDASVVDAANQEIRIWKKLHSLMLGYASSGHALSPLRLLHRDHYPEVQFLELRPGRGEQWEICAMLLRNFPSLRTFVFDTYFMRQEPKSITFPLLRSVTTLALPYRHVSLLGMNFTPNASTIVLLWVRIPKKRGVERKLEKIYDSLTYIAELKHSLSSLRELKMKGWRLASVKERSWPSIVQTRGLQVFDRLQKVGIAVLDQYGETLVGSDFENVDEEVKQ